MSVSFCLTQSTSYCRSHRPDNCCFLFPLLHFPLPFSWGFMNNCFTVGFFCLSYFFACFLTKDLQAWKIYGVPIGFPVNVWELPYQDVWKSWNMAVSFWGRGSLCPRVPLMAVWQWILFYLQKADQFIRGDWVCHKQLYLLATSSSQSWGNVSLEDLP